jgi:hypothetical protein
MSASLIARSRSSAFRLPTEAVLMLAGSAPHVAHYERGLQTKAGEVRLRVPADERCHHRVSQGRAPPHFMSAANLRL